MRAPADLLRFPSPAATADHRRWTRRRRDAAVIRAREALINSYYDLSWHFSLRTGRAMQQLRSQGVPREVALRIISDEFETYRRWTPAWKREVS